MRNKRLAFTLIELIIVIILLGILAAISLPKLFDLRTEAAEAVNLALYQSFLTNLEQAKHLHHIRGNKPGWLDINDDGTHNLYFRQGLSAPIGAPYVTQSGAPRDYLFDTPPIDENRACAGLLIQLTGTNLKIGVLRALGSTSFANCKTAGFDVCLLGYTGESHFACDFLFTNTTLETETHVPAIGYYIVRNELDGLPTDTQFVFYRHAEVFYPDSETLSSLSEPSAQLKTIFLNQLEPQAANLPHSKIKKMVIYGVE